MNGSSWKDIQIAPSIVGGVGVDMMNYLFLREAALEAEFSDQATTHHILVTFSGHRMIWPVNVIIILRVLLDALEVVVKRAKPPIHGIVFALIIRDAALEFSFHGVTFSFDGNGIAFTGAI